MRIERIHAPDRSSLLWKPQLLLRFRLVWSWACEFPWTLASTAIPCTRHQNTVRVQSRLDYDNAWTLVSNSPLSKSHVSYQTSTGWWSCYLFMCTAQRELSMLATAGPICHPHTPKHRLASLNKFTTATLYFHVLFIPSCVFPLTIGESWFHRSAGGSQWALPQR